MALRRLNFNRDGRLLAPANRRQPDYPA